MRRLILAHGLELPPESATETVLIVGKRGSGKSSTAVRMAEQMAKAHLQFAVLDPVDVWWGLKAGREGRPEGGLDVYVFGGEHADLPLESTAGVLMADVLVDHRINAVFVLRQFSNREKARFVSDFAEQLFKRNRAILHLFCEEAHEVMPQQPFRGEEEMLGRMLRLQKQGRTSGIGLTSITQRPASLNKNATTQSEVLIAHRLLGPQDRDAVEAWIKHHHVEEQKQEVLSTLPLLKTGEAWLWAPDFPESAPIGLRRIKVLMPMTFDSRQTPKPGEKRVEPEALAPVDLEKLRVKMAKTIEKAKAEDPRELRRQVADLQRQLHVAQRLQEPTSEPAPMIKTKIKEVPVLKKGEVKRLKAMAEFLGRHRNQMQESLNTFHQALPLFDKALERLQAIITPVVYLESAPALKTLRQVFDQPKEKVTPSHGYLPVRTHAHAGNGDQVSRSQQRILNALVWAEGIGLSNVDKTQLALLSDQRPTSGGYFNNLGALRSAGLIIYPGPGLVSLTGTGHKFAEPVDVPTTSDELQQMLYNKLPTSQTRILKVLIKQYPGAISKDELAEASNQKPTSGGYFNNLGRLRSLGLIDYPSPGHAVANPVLFLKE